MLVNETVARAKALGVDTSSVRYEELGAAMGAIHAGSRRNDGRSDALVKLIEKGVAVAGKNILISTDRGEVTAVIETVGTSVLIVRTIINGRVSTRTYRIPAIFVIGPA
ncbi:MAG: hypothetical protein BWY43_00294 [candidate division WS2 bacterium ADurb.Bin280]|uniref:Uncharacterized protein n=1 Tax=candidate division WS2 bacterium ADurb.Bin280 TaxID=1852829 RepID=A0A1V5SFA4_9BACT|nr:MAG: hypothetical protein BWY43_00294 [candidate division WS2 bacterium ADurb.Bin280]